MAAEIFISHSSKDIGVAETICAALESRGLSCWISSRDVHAGDNFADAIVEAIALAKVMLLVFSANANNSSEIKKELVVASYNKTVVVPVRVEDVVPSGAMRYELATRQWIDLFADWEREVDRLARRIKSLVTAKPPPLHDAAAPGEPDRAAVARPGPGAPVATDGDPPAPLATALYEPEPWRDTHVPNAPTPADLTSLLPVERAPPQAAEARVLWRRPHRRRPMLLLMAAAVVVAVIAAIAGMRHFRAPAPVAAVPATGADKGETVGYVAGLDPYNDNFLSLRTGPGTDYPEIYRMGENTFVHVIATAGKWTRVRLNGGQVGWAYSEYLRPGYPPR